MKKSLVLALVAVLVLSFASMAFAFTDTPDWAKTQIDKLAEMKIVNGVSATSFNAAGNVTRAEFAKMIVLAKGISLENPAKATFSDVPTTAWFFPYVEAAAKAKLIDGIGDGKFAPTANITREQVAKIVVLAAGKAADTTLALNFDDKASISDWAKGFVAQAANLKLMQGSNNKFAPKANATRAEGAVLVYNELVYEGKITAVVAADQITDVKFKTFAAGEEYPITNITIGGKRYDVDSKVDVTLNGEQINGLAVRKGTHAKATLDSDDVVTKLELSTTDYKATKAKVEALGKAGATTFAVVSGTKYNYDINADNFVSVDSDYKTVAKAAPAVGKTYVVLADERGFAYYFGNVDDASVKGIVEYVGKETKVYLYVNGKKYSADETSTTAEAVYAGGIHYTWASLAGKYVEFSLDSSDYVDAGTLVINNAFAGYVADKPILVGPAGVGPYDVYIKVAAEQTNNQYDAADYFWVHYGYSVDYIADSDAPDHAVIQPAAPATAGHDVVALDKYAGIYVNGSSKDLSQVGKRSYVVLKYKEAGKVNNVDFYSASAVGRVEKVTKDSSNNVTKVTIGGKEFTYNGRTAAHTTSDEGKLWSAAAKNLIVVAVDDLVAAALDQNGNLTSIITTYTANSENEATVTAVGGGKSLMSKNATDADVLYVPANTIEVKYTSGGVTKLAWLNYAWLDNGTGSHAGNRSYNDEEVSLSGVFKANAPVAFSTIKVNDVVDFATVDGFVYTGKEASLPKFLFKANSTSTLNDGDYTWNANSFTGVASPALDGSYYYKAAGYVTTDDATASPAGKPANWFFESTPALFINVR